MMYLSQIIEKRQSELFEKMGVFFAFGQNQFDEQKKEGVKYATDGAGTFIPKENVKEFYEELEKIQKMGVKEDIEMHGIENIIKRELGNLECYYLGYYGEDLIERLEQYGISEDQILEVWNKTKYDYEIF